MTSYGYTIDLMEFQAEALKRILKNAIRDAKKVEPESRESALKHVDAVVDQKIIEKLWDCGTVGGITDEYRRFKEDARESAG